ncbi:MAG: PadR family transcriptional regulator [Burkholderiaceae bacterium]|nr:PadR family transcriptional regulator [Microbacteriaceae bacterium]
MSVRDGLVAVLTLGPAYGLQLHAEFASRASHRGPVNVGQIYSTLDRLTTQSLIRPSGETHDGLPLHRLTSAGRTAARQWQTVPCVSGLPEWTDMLDQVLVTATLHSGRALGLVSCFEEWWAAELAGSATSTVSSQGRAEERLARSAAAHRAQAALDWLADARSVIDARAVRGYSDLRPRRGRRPSAPVAP